MSKLKKYFSASMRVRDVYRKGYFLRGTSSLCILLVQFPVPLLAIFSAAIYWIFSLERFEKVLVFGQNGHEEVQGKE